MKTSSSQAGILPPPSIIDIVKIFMIEEGFDESLFRRELAGAGFSYDGWHLGGVDNRSGRFYMLPFATNADLYLNPEDPEFFNQIREAIKFPTTGPFAGIWKNKRWTIPYRG